MLSLFPPPGPPLPSFQSLLIRGKYHASAPIHLCLSHALEPETSKVLLVVPSRSALKRSLKQLKDEWIKTHGGEGRTSGAAMKVQVLYPPTPAHLTYLLSLLHEALLGQKDFLHAKTTFATTPSLVVLCELASYFPDASDAIVSSYLMLVRHALATVSSLSAQSGKCTSLAVFDSKLDNYLLPLMRPPSPGGFMQEEAQASASNARRESVGFLAERYFEWTGTVEQEVESDVELMQEIEEESTGIKRMCKLHLQQRPGVESKEVTLNWTERTSEDGGTMFTWPL